MPHAEIDQVGPFHAEIFTSALGEGDSRKKKVLLDGLWLAIVQTPEIGRLSIIAAISAYLGKEYAYEFAAWLQLKALDVEERLSSRGQYRNTAPMAPGGNS